MLYLLLLFLLAASAARTQKAVVRTNSAGVGEIPAASSAPKGPTPSPGEDMTPAMLAEIEALDPTERLRKVMALGWPVQAAPSRAAPAKRNTGAARAAPAPQESLDQWMNAGLMTRNLVGDECPPTLNFQCFERNEDADCGLYNYGKCFRAPDSSGLGCTLCAPGQVCSNRRCKDSYPPMERACTFNEECEPAISTFIQTPWVCSSGFCTQSINNSLIAGDFCVRDSDCKGGNLQCRASAPGAPRRCRLPATVTASNVTQLLCAAQEECPFDHYCLGGVCTPRKTAGQTSSGDFQCEQDLISSDGFCRPAFSLFLEADCGSERGKIIGCSPGLLCVEDAGNFLCKQDGGYIQGALCTGSDESVPPRERPNPASSCPEYYRCSCLHADPDRQSRCRARLPPTRYCSDSWEALLQCANENECRTDRTDAPPGSCLYERCLSQFTCLNVCQADAFDIPPEYYPGCSYADSDVFEACYDSPGAALPSLFSTE